MLFGMLLKRILGSLFWKNKQKIPEQFNSLSKNVHVVNKKKFGGL